jgi:hypothetical protein
LRRRHLVEHLAEPVHRQNDAIKVGNTREQNSTSNTRVARVTRVVSQTKQQVVLSDDIIFVNNGGPVGNGIQAGDDVTGDGTAEKPKSTIQAGADVAATNNLSSGRVWNVYTQHSATNYTEDVAITESVNFISSATPLMGSGGKRFGAGLMPVLDGSFSACGCIPLSFVGIAGYEIHAAAFAAIDMVNVQTLKIASNKISNTSGLGISVEMFNGNAGTAEITGNVINQGGLGFDGLSFLVAGVDSFLDAVVTGNTITGSSFAGVSFQVFDEALADLHMTSNNVIGNGFSGLSINLQFGDVIATLANNHFDSNGSHGVSIILDNAGTPGTESFLDFDSVGDTFSSNVGDGLHIESYNESVFSPGTISFAHFENNGGRPLEATTNTDGSIDLFVQNSTILSTNGLGVHGVVGDGSSGFPDLSLFFFNSTIDVSGVGPAVGIQIEAPSTGIAFLGVVDNTTVTANGGLESVGIQLLGTGISCGCDPSIGALVYDSSINVAGLTAIGIDINASGPSGLGSSFVALDMQHSNITSDDRGVQIVAIDSAIVEAGIGDGSNIGAAANGVTATASGSSIVDVGIFGGTSISGAASGVEVAASDSASVSLDIFGGASITGGVNGVKVTGIDSSIVDVGIFDSVVAGQQIGVFLTEGLGAELNATVVGNTLTAEPTGTGIKFDKGGASLLTDFSDNVITGTNFGIAVTNTSATAFTANIANNETNASTIGIQITNLGGDFDANINANTVTGTGIIGIHLESFAGGTIHVNPAPTILDSNTIDVNRILKLSVLTAGGAVDGSIIINGATLAPPVNFP